MNIPYAQIWKKYKELIKLVKEDHEEVFCGGHPFSHAVITAQYAAILAESINFEIEVAWIAGLLHNADHYSKKVASYLEKLLGETTSFDIGIKALIITAILNHSGLNDSNDTLLLKILRDADKLANIDSDLPIRCGQFRPNLPIFEPEYVRTPNPESTYQNPTSIVEDLRLSMEWQGDDSKGIPWINLDKTRKMAKPLFARLQTFINGFAEQIKRTGLKDFPW